MSGRDLGGLRVVLAGAQTGGHLYPAVATGRRLQELGATVTLVASGEPAEERVLKDAGIPVEVLKVGKLKGMGLKVRLAGLAKLPGSFLRARRLLRRLRPDLVVGFGGYTTGPLVLTAALSGTPSAVCEQNSVPGFTNRVLARFARRAFLTFDEATRHMAAREMHRTGSPVRPEILAVPAKHYAGHARRVLVLGGSQGSAFLNSKVPPMLARVAASIEGLEVLHQAGTGRDKAVREAYAAAGAKADVREYLFDVASAWAWADVLVARSGAGTVTEASAIGVPALYVPFAAAADNHQVANARPLVIAGGALMVEEREFETEAVAARLAGVMSDPAALAAMAAAARSWGRRDALDRIVDGLLEMVGR
jgi:UDP-N-acetylglucosamine--N-acetylmuramyl-(pentapeptide) pyrophosphoryl-undecaprenol N-acetylglucosamine transferase